MNPEDRLRELKDPERWMNVRVPRAAGPARARSGTTPARAVQLVVAFAVTIVAVVGTLVVLEAAHRTAPPAGTASAAPTAPHASSATPAFSVVPGGVHQYSVGTPPPACTLAQLQTESKQDGGGAAGTYIQAVYVHNTGPDCLLAPDVVQVSGEVARFDVTGTVHGLVLPALATARLWVTAPFVCYPAGRGNITSPKPVLPITLRIDGETRAMSALYPRFGCAHPTVEAQLDPGTATHFPSAVPGLEAVVNQPTATTPGVFRYDVALRNTGKAALVLTACPVATEVLSQGVRTVTRELSLRCSLRTALEPDEPVSVPVSTTIPAKGDWTVSWFLGGGASTTAASTTCTLEQLRVSEPSVGGGSAGNWVQLVAVRNQGATCTLPVTAFSVGGRVARAGRTSDVGGIRLTPRSTTEVAVSASNTCPDGSMNIRSTRDPAGDDKPIVLTLGGAEADGLDRPFPQLHCAGPIVEPID